MSDRKCKSKISCSISVIFVGGLIFAAPCYAQTADQPPPSGTLGTAQDCTQVQVDYSENPTLTDAEKLALMDRALFQSLSRYDACANSSADTSGSGGGAGAGSSGGGSDGGGGGLEGEGTGDNAQAGDNGRGMSTASDLQGTEQSTSETAASASGGSSVASSDMSGTEKPKQEPGAGEASVQANLDASGTASLEEGDVENGSDRQEVGTIDNGKVPDDIPPADNDSVLEAQIRQAAINETDPEIKAKLWDEYRRYKGLPTKK